MSLTRPYGVGFNKSAATAESQIELSSRTPSLALAKITIQVSLYLLLMSIMALPLFGVRVPKLLPSIWLLAIHEVSGFLFFGHTLFSNIWSMRVRQTQGLEAGIWARGFIRKLALTITLPTTIVTPLAGLMLIEDWGGLGNAPWAYDAYLSFWLMAGISLWPDLIRLAVDEHADEPTHGMLSGGLRGMVALALTGYIIFCMITKQALITG